MKKILSVLLVLVTCFNLISPIVTKASNVTNVCSPEVGKYTYVASGITLTLGRGGCKTW